MGPNCPKSLFKVFFVALEGIYLRPFTASEPFGDLLKALMQGAADMSTDLHDELEA